MNEFVHTINLLKKENFEEMIETHKKIGMFLLELYGAETKYFSEFKDTIEKIKSEKSKSGYAYFSLKHPNFRLSSYPSEDNTEGNHMIHFPAWFHEENSKRYAEALFKIITELDIDVINGESSMEYDWANIYNLKDAPETQKEYLSKKNYTIHYLSNEFIKEKLDNDISFIKFKLKFDMKKGILLVSTRNMQPLDKYIQNKFKDYLVEEKEEENLVKEKQELPERAKGKKLERGMYSEIEYKCENCKASGKMEINKRFIEDGAPCPKCGKKKVKFEMKKITWLVG